MIRPTVPDDIPAVLTLAEATGLFSASALELLHQMLTESVGENSDSKPFWLTDDDNGPVGVAYCEPERMTDSTWNLQLIAIHPDRQRERRGTKLLQHVEQVLQARSGRMLLVETSGVPEFESTRAFYKHWGFEQEACIRDFYAIADDKVVFRKVLRG